MTLSKRESHLIDLRAYTFANNEIQSYLLTHSNLPGKRGNIELGFSFADYVAENYDENKEALFTYCLQLITENPPDKNSIGNEEFLPFCAIVALGRIGKIDPENEDEVIELLKVFGKDSRWRIREAVAMAIQELMDVHPQSTMKKLHLWVYEDNYLVYRALVAGLAEPRLMKNRDTAKSSLEIHKTILESVARETNTRDKDYQTLVKGLCYTLSVIITGIEDEGFAYLESLTKSENPVIRKIVRENLKKARLKRLNEERVLALQHALEMST